MTLWLTKDAVKGMLIMGLRLKRVGKCVRYATCRYTGLRLRKYKWSVA